MAPHIRTCSTIFSTTVIRTFSPSSPIPIISTFHLAELHRQGVDGSSPLHSMTRGQFFPMSSTAQKMLMAHAPSGISSLWTLLPSNLNFELSLTLLDLQEDINVRVSSRPSHCISYDLTVNLKSLVSSSSSKDAIIFSFQMGID